MKAEIISVGTELLLGDIVNTNSQYLSSELAALGIGVYFHTTVGDNAGRLSGALELAVSRSNVIILTGGLGPTKDDITKETVCKALDIPLVEDLETKIWIESHYSRMKIPKGDNILKQAMVPEGATVFTNHRGTAPGLALESGNQCIIMLPGPPNELKPMVELDIRKFLRSRYAQGIIISHSVNLFGVSESAAAERLGELLNGENPTVAPYAKMGEVRIRITARAEDANTANKMIRPVLSSVAQMFHGNVYGVDKDSLQQAAVEKLKSKWCTVATAESCTAGLLAKRITDIPGSSDVFETGYITYSNAAKTEQLGVPEELLKRYGAVSPETAEAMAKGARLKSGAELGIAVTGIAGPGGGTPEKPVGLVYIALSGSNKMVYKKIQVGRLADREYVRTFASSTALFMLIDFLRNDYEPSSKAGTAQENAPDGGKTEVCTLPVKETGTAQDYAVEIEDVKENAGSKFEQIEEQKHDTFPTEDDMQEISSYSENTAPESVKKNIIGGVAVIKKEQEYGKLITDKKRSLAYRFFSRVLPWRGDSAGEKIRKLLFLVALTVLIVSGTFLLNYYMEGNQNQSRIDDLAEIYDSYEVEDDPELDVVQQSYNRFKGLLERNGDIVGWLRVPGTKINNPVMQSSDPSDPDYYLYRGFDKEETRYGSAYVD
ncbi:MAG TPA: competence/damage-inducible protein A, partial [Ruminococcaceae bacterium]|nr:competence/damage-inducible protein A [Oscillospiraceae bacterium]